MPFKTSKETRCKVSSHLDELCCPDTLKKVADAIIQTNQPPNPMKAAIRFGLFDILPRETDTKESIQRGYNTYEKNISSEWRRVGCTPNTGHPLSENTLGVKVKNYSPSTDNFRFADDPLTTNRIHNSNGCISVHRVAIVNSVAREAGGQVAPAEYVATAFIDAITIVLIKDRYAANFAAACKLAGITKTEGYLISVILLGYHAKFYQKCHGEGQRLPVAFASANAYKNMIDSRFTTGDLMAPPFMTQLMELCRKLPHGECVLNSKYLLQFDEQQLRAFGYREACFLNRVFSVDLSRLVASHSIVYLKYSGYLFMSDEERADLNEARKDLLAKIAKARAHLEATITKAFKGDALTEADLNQYKKRYNHVMLAAERFAILTRDGSNAAQVAGEIHAIFSVDASGEDVVSDNTRRSRWNSFFDRCMKVDSTLCQLLRQAASESGIRDLRRAASESISSETIADAFENGVLTEEDMAMTNSKFTHVVKAAAATFELMQDGSNAPQVFDKIDKIFAKDSSGEDVLISTLKRRWDTFLDRYKTVDPFLSKRLNDKRQEVNIERERARVPVQVTSTGNKSKRRQSMEAATTR